MTDSDLKLRIIKRLKATAKSARGASLEAGLSDAFIRNILAGKSRSPRVENFDALASVLGTTADWLLKGEGPEVDPGFGARAKPDQPARADLGTRPVRNDIEPNTDLSQAKDLPNFRGFGGPRDVPVRGTALGGSGEDGDFQFTSDVNLGHEPRQPGIMGRKGIYVVYVQNDSMDPKFEPGDRLYVDPHRPPRPMDYVVIELHGDEGESGRGYIKRLLRKTPTRVIVEQFNPRKEIEFETDEVKAIHRVIPHDELLGV
jgi:phage repressor protein C with HTH and peptisase S24 domain